MQEICLIDECRGFWERNTEKYHLRSLWRSVILVTVRRWHHSAAAEGRWGSLIKCGATECVTDRHSHDGLSCWFVMKIREVVQYPNSKSSSVMERRSSTNRCAYDDPSYLSSRVMKRATEEISQVWDDGVHDGQSWPWRSVTWSVDPVSIYQK